MIVVVVVVVVVVVGLPVLLLLIFGGGGGEGVHLYFSGTFGNTYFLFTEAWGKLLMPPALKEEEILKYPLLLEQ